MQMDGTIHGSEIEIKEDSMITEKANIPGSAVSQIVEQPSL